MTQRNETLVVSHRGRFTLPAVFLRRFGIKGGDVLILEDRGSEIVLKPRVALTAQFYTDDQIAEWDTADRLLESELTRVLEKLSGTE